jgi:hypothetical protein
MFILPIKKQWFDMIASGEKKEEYREIKPYYTSRIAKIWCNNYHCGEYYKREEIKFIEFFKMKGQMDFGVVIFRNGYSAKSRRIVTNCSLRIGTGNTEWGAEAEKEYYVFSIEKYNIIEA